MKDEDRSLVHESVTDEAVSYTHLDVYKRQDFGMERGTEYGLEQIYAVIDGRYRSGKPLIATTNLTPVSYTHLDVYKRQV